ncbi:cytochrome P450 [Streptosporangium sp. NBC_01639]|uniref:cytochrome P450 n=1 Tax=Streptosporangium sp. NBC_01639 TaxID=2975948 RepID=UPI00386C870A|nr:cytochrome P450 [Streptosporangium sp. NBC_01639]
MTENSNEPPVFPMARKCPFDPPPEYAKMRAEDPVTKVKLQWSQKEFWVVTRQEHVRQVLSDSTMSSNWKLPHYPLQVPVPDEMLQQLELPLVGTDPPEHSPRRRMLIPELTAKRVQALRPRIQEIVDDHIDAMLKAGGPVDLVTALAFPVPALLFCELLGVPAEDSDFFRSAAETLVRTDVEQDEMIRSQIALEAYLDKLVTRKETEEGDDLLRRIVVKNRETPTIERRDIVNLAKNLLFGGFDTTSNMIALGVLVLLENPDQLAAVREDPSLLPQAIEELIRYLSIADSSPARAVRQDIEVGGVLIREGEGIIALTASANRDESVWEDADTFDIYRKPIMHSAFGHGIHQCPGANLVRYELEIVFGTLISRIPGLRLAVPLDEIAFKSGTLVQGVHGELPVTW